MSAAQPPAQPAEPARQRYRLRPSGCCDLPRIVHLTDAEAAPGLAAGLLTALPDAAPAPQPTPSNPSPSP